MRRLVKFAAACAAAAALAVPVSAMAGSGGVTGPSFYVDGSLCEPVP